MEKLIGLIIFLVIYIISKSIENAQKTRSAQKKKPEPVNARVDYTKPRNKPAGPLSNPEKVITGTGGYHAPENEVEDFLKSIGVIKDEPPAQRKEQKIQKPAYVKKITQRKKEVQVTQQVTQPVQESGKVACDDPLAEPITFFEEIGYESGFDRSLLSDKNNLKNAFILTEILKPPLALRKSRNR